MMCNCSLTEKIVGILVIIFAWWQTGYNDWILTVLGAILIIHAFSCKSCKMPMPAGKAPMTKKPVVKKKKKK